MHFLKYNLSLFVQKSFNYLEQNNEYQHNWHIDLITDYLTAISNGNLKRLIVNIPPRNMKSLIINVAWPAWLMGLDPSFKIISASFNKNLSIKHALDSREIIDSRWYKSIFQDTILSKNQNSKEKFMTSMGGHRISTSVNSSMIGEGADLLILDDPHNPLNINSSKQRKKVIDWFEKSFITRLNNKKKGAVIIIMQRLHHNDICGHLLRNYDDWHLLKIPAEVQGKFFSYNKTFLFENNDLLNKQRDCHNQLKKLKTSLGEANFQAQYMQEPINHNNGILKNSLIQFKNIDYSKLTPYKIIISLDTAIKSKDISDYSVATIWLNHGYNHYLVDVFRKKLEYPQLLEEVKNLISKWNADTILIEDKASGQILIQDLKMIINHNIIPIRPQYDKITRFSQIIGFFEAERIILSEQAPWLDTYLDEILSFPHSIHDDQVDSTSQYLLWQKTRKNNTDQVIKFI